MCASLTNSSRQGSGEPKSRKLVSSLIEELDSIETDTDEKQAALRASLFKIEKTLDPVDAVFMYKVIELLGEIHDMAERVGRRLELLL